MAEKILLECPVYTAEAALQAEPLKVDRLELCSSYREGGETPGAGMLDWIKSRTALPVFVMIRPRGGDFVYSSDEIEVMKSEIRILAKTGADGFVFGVLKPDGTINQDACKTLLERADGRPCTFHRAFDVCRNLSESLEIIIDCGFRRLLTSGGENSVSEGLTTIADLLLQAEDRIIVMPGGGLTPSLVPPLRSTGKLKEVHSTCKSLIPGHGRFSDRKICFVSDDLQPDQRLSLSALRVNEYHQALQ